MKTSNPVIALPAAIAGYWNAANAGRVDEAAAHFSADAVVQDEGKNHSGTEAIRSWIEETTCRYRPVVAPLRLEEKAGRIRVTARVSGDFSGSPVELEFGFALRDGKIQRLEIQ